MHHNANYDYYEIVCSIKGDGHQSAPVQSLAMGCGRGAHAPTPTRVLGGGAPYHVTACLLSDQRQIVSSRSLREIEKAVSFNYLPVISFQIGGKLINQGA